MANKINRGAQEESTNHMTDHVEQSLGQVTVAGAPMLICGVNRKINTGNFENVDVYAGITLPLGDVSPSDMDALRSVVNEVAELGFHLTSVETGDRYELIKAESKKDKS